MRENDPVDLCYAARKQKPRSLFPAGILLPTTVNHADAFAAAADKTLPLSDVEHGKAASFSPTKMFMRSLNCTSKETNFLNPSICNDFI